LHCFSLTDWGAETARQGAWICSWLEGDHLTLNLCWNVPMPFY
jgi:hypothetical protein